MKRETITRMLNGLDDRYIGEAAAFDPDAVQGGPERIIHMKKKRIITFALAAALILSLGVAAYAGRWFGLKELRTGVGSSTSVVVAGVPDSPEEQAAKEWQEYKLHARNNLPNVDLTFSDTDLVSQVGAHSPEAIEKLNELLRKYDLSLPEQILYIRGVEGLYSVCGLQDFLPETADTDDSYPVSGRYYRGGAFTVADVAKQGEKTVRFDMIRSVKGYFTGVVGFLLDVDGMEEWTYTTSAGIETTLALGPARAAAIIPLENSFVYIHFRSGSDSGYDKNFDLLTREDVEAFVDAIDFLTLDNIR